MVQVLREITPKLAKKTATKKHTTEEVEKAERIAAELIEEEEREQAAKKKKVRGRAGAERGRERGNSQRDVD